MAKWTREQTTLLLELYKECPHLYDHRNIGYSDRNERQNSLVAIAKKLEKIRPRTTVRDLKQKIRTIRTQYCVERHKFIRSQSKDLYTPRLWCYDILQFLDGVTSLDGVRGKKPYYRAAQQDPLRKSIVDSTASRQTDVTISLEVNNEEERDLHMEHVEQSPDPPEAIICDETESVSPTVEQHANYKNSRNYVFSEFIREELDSIKDREILEDAKWDIQTAIRNALKQDRAKTKHLFQSIEQRIMLSPSSSQSSSSAYFQNTSNVKPAIHDEGDYCQSRSSIICEKAKQTNSEDFYVP